MRQPVARGRGRCKEEECGAHPESDTTHVHDARLAAIRSLRYWPIVLTCRAGTKNSGRADGHLAGAPGVIGACRGRAARGGAATANVPGGGYNADHELAAGGVSGAIFAVAVGSRRRRKASTSWLMLASGWCRTASISCTVTVALVALHVHR